MPQITGDNPNMKKEKPTFWRSFNHLENNQEYQNFLTQEFPQGAEQLSDPVTRRNFMKIMSASAALAGLTACRMPKETIVPFVHAPEKMIPGTPKYYATVLSIGGLAKGVLVENHDGRPTMIQGNDKHPSSLGAVNEFDQASILSLYDPERLKISSHNGAPQTWSQFETYWREKSATFVKTKGEGLAVITNSNPSITFARLQKDFVSKFPKATWVSYDALDTSNIQEGLKLIQSKNITPFYQFDKAQVVVSFGHDFLGTDSDSTRHQKGFSKRRRVRDKEDAMNRLYAVESSFTLTGSNADHRIKLNPSEMDSFVLAVYQEVAKHVSLPKVGGTPNAHGHDSWVKALAKDLLAHHKNSVISAGKASSPQVHALVHLLNQALGNVGQSVFYTPTSNTDNLSSLVEKAKNNQIKTLIVLGANPAYDTAFDLSFADVMSKSGEVIVAAIAENETTQKANWILAQSHALESWSDALFQDGTQSIAQPMIRPLFDTQSDIEILNLLTNLSPKQGYEIVRDTWKGQNWNQILHDGLKNGSSFVSVAFSPKGSIQIEESKHAGLEIEFIPSASTLDGQFANNGWLQEMPHPITKISWDNPAWISPSFAKKNNLKNGQMITLSKEGRSLTLPVWIVPGQPNNTITLELGFGRSVCGSIGKDVGFNTYQLRSHKHPYAESGFEMKASSEVVTLANTQDHGSMEDRPLVRMATLEAFRKNPAFAKEAVEHPPLKSLWKEHPYTEGYQWGMSIDLNTCTGCNSCLIACQTENNIPIVGKEQVNKGREMHWIRMDRYFSGSEEDPMIVFQPVACVHCENAPCEQVCPVNATVHDEEGLNTMIYNRCIGTRYCSNNCPYKVRRFNFFNYIKESPIPTSKSKLVQMSNNPDVTIRFRGVMEKCTYCTQRIEEVRSHAKLENRAIKDGEIKTACQSACPSDCIVFGNINDPESEVSKLKKLEQDYAMLAEINIKPRTTYLAKLRNPNPEIEDHSSSSNHHGSH
ncbi:MAG: TAT-variant-translocated molybdopterin oxidoreductase [Bdellovibrionales bacterium]|nr:TAT-variant-translocated molybdopterin oxidoreductase [Bdellovibrionales bacterium]